jgi:hypothetical protein
MGDAKGGISRTPCPPFVCEADDSESQLSAADGQVSPRANNEGLRPLTPLRASSIGHPLRDPRQTVDGLFRTRTRSRSSAVGNEPGQPKLESLPRSFWGVCHDTDRTPGLAAVRPWTITTRARNVVVANKATKWASRRWIEEVAYA